MDYRDIESKVLQWGAARGITTNGTLKGQATKTVEEAVELLEAIGWDDRPAMKDAIGDVLVTLVMVGALAQIDVLDAFESAYNEIKDRKGYLGPDGIFHKDQ